MAEFFSSYFDDHRPLHVTNLNLNENSALLSALLSEPGKVDKESLLYGTASDEVMIWIPHPNARDDPTLPMTSIKVAPDAAYALSHSHSTYCRAPREAELKLTKMYIDDLGLGLGNINYAYGEVETFHSASNHVTPPHYDFQVNFTIQVSGEKVWKLGRGPPAVELGATPHFVGEGVREGQVLCGKLADPEFTYSPPPLTSEVKMSAGDVLFFPPGCWHTVHSTSPGLSINISLKCKTYADVYCDALKASLKTQREWRALVRERGELGRLIEGSRRLAREGGLGLDVEEGWVLPEGTANGTYVGMEEEQEVVLEEEEDEEEEEEEVEVKSKIVNVDEECPHDVAARTGATARINPICAVLTFEEAFGPDGGPGDDSDDSDAAQTNRYAVNINYAGDEFYRANVRFLVECEERGEADLLLSSVQRSRRERGAELGDELEGLGGEAEKWMRWMGVIV